MSPRVRRSTSVFQQCFRGGARFLATFTEEELFKASGTIPKHDFFAGHAHSVSSSEQGGLSQVYETGTGLKSPPGWKFSCISMAGFKSKRVAANQDAFSYTTLDSGWQLAVVCDGHGVQGDVASTRVARLLPYILARDMAKGISIKEALHQAFLEANEDLVNGATVDGDFSQSGTTATVACIHAERLEAWIAWVGDARGVVGNLDDGKIVFSSRDHAPHEGEEQIRIEKTGADIRLYTDEESGSIVGSRVYDPETSMGLSMSRSLGDMFLKPYGVIPDPEVEDVSDEWAKCRSPIFCLASDGLWGYMDSHEVIEDLAEGRRGGRLALETLCWNTQQMWLEEEDAGYCDDITVVCLHCPAAE